MADFSIRFYSTVLRRDVSFLMVIPNDIRMEYPREDLKRKDLQSFKAKGWPAASSMA